MTALGGPADLTAAVRASGKQAGPRSTWVGSWMLKSGWASLQNFYASCKQDGASPLVLFWWWGDDISPTAIDNGVQDSHQGVFKTKAQALDAATKIGAFAKTAGVVPTVVIENEFNKSGCDKSPSFASYFDQAAAAIRAACPGARIVFAPGNWGDLKALVTFYQKQVDESDLIGLQSLASVVRGGVTSYDGMPARLAAGLAALRSGPGRAGTLPAIVYDFGLSTYGGAFATTPPFAGGDGKAMETEQAKVLVDLASKLPSMNVESLVYRSLKDSASMDVGNYFGYGERFWGVVRADGTSKPGLPALLALAAPAAPAGPSVADLQAQVKSLTADKADLQARYDRLKGAIKTALDSAT